MHTADTIGAGAPSHHCLTRKRPLSMMEIIKRINWVHASILIPTPILTLYGMMTTELIAPTFWWAFIYYFITGLGITAGYHRLWAHNAYHGSFGYRLWMALAGAGAVEGSIKWWCQRHRAHHRYTDTDDDPYSAHKGLLWSHIGWMLMKADYNPKLRRIDMSDLLSDPIVYWQHKFYGAIAIFWGFLFPFIVAGLGWGDWRGGFFYAAVGRLVFVHHATFCVNSLAHYLGEATFDDTRTPRDHFFTAVVTLGEGYHNFHHEFPQDYRNAIRFYQYDPTKWLIRFMSFFGVTYNLKTFPKNEITKGQIQMREKEIIEQKKKLNWGVSIDQLPTWDAESFKKNLRSSPELLVIDNVVYNVSKFIDDHPGGRSFLKINFGKDATKLFNGGVYKHSNAARNLMTHFRIAKLENVDLTCGKAKEE